MPRKRTGYDAACYYDGKLLGRCTKADSDAYTLLMNACGGDAARVLREYAYFSPELKAILEKAALMQADRSRTGGMFHAPLKTGAFLAAAAATQLTLGRFVRREEGGKKALLGAFSMGLAGIFFAISRSGLGLFRSRAGGKRADAYRRLSGRKRRYITFTAHRLPRLYAGRNTIAPSACGRRAGRAGLCGGAFFAGCPPALPFRVFPSACRKAGRDWRGCGGRRIPWVSAVPLRRSRNVTFYRPQFGRDAGGMLP